MNAGAVPDENEVEEEEEEEEEGLYLRIEMENGGASTHISVRS